MFNLDIKIHIKKHYENEIVSEIEANGHKHIIETPSFEDDTPRDDYERILEETDEYLREVIPELS